MRAAVKIPLLVDEQAAAVLDSQSRIANWLYNKLLEIANDLRTQYRASQDQAVGRTLYTERGLRDQIPALKAQHPFLKSVYSSPLKNAALRLSQAIKAHQDGKHGRRAKAVNWPRFRAWKRSWFSLQYDEPWKGYALCGRTLTLSLGKDATGKQLKLTLHLSEALPHWVNHDQIRQCRIAKEGQIYTVIFTIERRLPGGKPLHHVGAASPNHKNFAYAVGTDGKATETHNPYFLKALDKRSDRLKAKRDRCKKQAKQVTRADGSTFWLPSRRWRYLNARLQDVYRIRREQTKQFLYTVANRLYCDYDAVGIGDYVPHGGGINRKMRRSMNNQSLNGRFKHVLASLALRSGKQSLEWEEGGSTRPCHDCGYVVQNGIPVEMREWNCPEERCKSHHIRDENAARNGLTRTRKRVGVALLGPSRGLLSACLEVQRART